jgi:phenylacetate-CoA ligase
MDDWKLDLYRRLPIFLQETALSLYARYLDGLYYGCGYEEWLRHFERLQASSASEAASWQDERLRSIIRLAATQVPYYRECWQRTDWRSVRSAGDLRILPRLEKQSLRQSEGKFLKEGVERGSLWLERTSGTTGTSLRIYWPKSMLPQWWALVEVSIRKVARVGQALPRAMVGGRTIVSGTTHRPPYWRFNRRWQQLYLSSYHLSKETAAGYAEALRLYDSKWITGYASAISTLAQYALEKGIPPVGMRAAIVSGDTLLPGMRRSIEQFFGCKCYDSYGQSEAVCMAMECPQGRLHVIPAAGIWEILREDGVPCEPGEVGEVVATGLLNDVMPLVRYRSGDYAAWAKEQVCCCGSDQPIISQLEGRLDDYLITGDRRKIGRLSPAMKRSPSIHSMQILQDCPGHAYLLVRPGVKYARSDALAVRDDLLQRIGAFEFELVEVVEIPKTAAGKTALVVRLSDRPEMTRAYQKLLKREGVLGQAA